MSTAEKFLECALEVLVDFVECFFKLLPRESIDFADGRLGVLN